LPLERRESEFSDDGIVPSWNASYDFLTGRSLTTTELLGAHPKRFAKQHPVMAFLLASFEAFASRYETK
jgi:hypothetical protein